MSEQPVQNFENHTKIPTTLMALAGVYVLALILGLGGLFFENIRVVAAGVIVACVGGSLALVNARLYSTTLQDRIIRLEMRLRMREVLPDELAADVMDYSVSQLVGLRFASDDELPELARKVLDENITSAKEVKMLVQHWQPDHFRV